MTNTESSRNDFFDRTWIVGLILLGLLTRLPFVTRILYHWDAVNFTLALRRYDIAVHQPQPPGYILYVLLGRAVNSIVQNPNRALTGISIVSSILAAAAIFLLGARMFDRRTGAAASLLLLLGPLIWFYSQIAKPNIIDAPLVTLIALLLWRVMKGDAEFVLPSAVMLGLAGGFRQQTLVFMAPLAVFAFRKQPFRRMLLGGAVTALVFLASFIPMVMLAGGWGPYQAAVAGLEGNFFTRTSIFLGGGLGGLTGNVAKWVSYTLYSLLLALVPLGVWPFVRARAIPAALKDERTWFLACWVTPSLLFYTLIHMGSHGLIFTFLPAVLLAAGKALVDGSALFRRNARAVFSAALIGILAVNVLVFLAAPDRPFPGRSVNIVNWSTLQQNDAFFGPRFDLLRQSGFDPAATVVVTEEWRHLEYYLPEYYVLSAPCVSGEDAAGEPGLLYLAHGGEYRELREAPLAQALPPGVQTVILFDGPAGCFQPEEWAGRLRKLSSPNGQAMEVLHLVGGEALSYTNGTFTIQH